MKLARPYPLLLCLAACSSTDLQPGDPPPNDAQTGTFFVSGTLTGASGAVTLTNVGLDDLVVADNGPFSFAAGLDRGAIYLVSARTPPAGQTCVVRNGQGVIADADITNVVVECRDEDPILDAGSDAGGEPDAGADAGGNTDAGGDAQVEPGTYAIGGRVEGLTGSLRLQNNGADDLTVVASGDFQFATPLAEGSAYLVTVVEQPSNQTCTVSEGQGLVGSSAVNDVSVVCGPPTTTLTTSVSALALSVTGIIEHGVAGTPLSGVARTITVSNTGAVAATGLSVQNPVFPVGTSASTSCPASLAPGASCTITLTPGSTASSDGANPCTVGTAPLPANIVIQGDNTNVSTVATQVLGYGCLHGGGHVFAFDDTTPNTASVGLKVSSTVDQAPRHPNGVLWSSAGNAVAAFDALFGINSNSTPAAPQPSAGQAAGQNACLGLFDGACASHNIHVYYQTHAVGSPIAANDYAAGLCTQAIGGHTDWYLPALCELGYGGAGCGTSFAPATQNMQSSLLEASALAAPTGIYWSSTQAELSPLSQAFGYSFGSPPAGPAFFSKSDKLGVRCVRKQ